MSHSSNLDYQNDLSASGDEPNRTIKSYFPLLELPTELLMTVFEYLESATVINTLSKVCKYLAEVVSDDLIWKVRIHKRWAGKRYPAIACKYQSTMSAWQELNYHYRVVDNLKTHYHIRTMFLKSSSLTF